MVQHIAVASWTQLQYGRLCELMFVILVLVGGVEGGLETESQGLGQPG